MSENTTTTPETEVEVSTTTPEQDAQKQAEMKAIKGAKYLAELFLQLPEHVEFTKEGIETALKPLVIEMMQKMADDGFCLTDIRSANEFAYTVLNTSLKRCENQTRNMLHQLYIQVFNVYEPEAELPFSEIEKRIIETRPAPAPEAPTQE